MTMVTPPSNITTERAERDAERARMADDMLPILRMWKDRNVHPAMMAAQLMILGLNIGELCGITRDDVIRKVHEFYGTPTDVKIPSAKA